jgi:DNA-damage-inducible protein J
MNATLQMRIDQRTKERASKAFRASGLDLSSGLRLFLSHVGRTGEVPFDLFSYQNAPEAVRETLVKEARTAARRGKAYKTVREMHTAILKET